MEDQLKETVSIANSVEISEFEPASRFLSDKAEKFVLLASYIIAFIYTFSIESRHTEIWLSVFTLLFCIASEIVYRKRKVSAESWIWLGSMAIILVSVVTDRNKVWGETSWLFMHAYAIYWILNRSGRMVEEKSSRFFLVDVVHGLFIIPFKNFFLRIKLIWSGFVEPEKGKTRSGSKVSSLVAIIVAAILLIVAVALLSSADEVFGRLLGDLLQRFDVDVIGSIIFRIIVSLPVGAYLFGLVLGAKREEQNLIAARGSNINRQLENLRLVPANVWSVLVAAFVILYMVFFVIQGSYLFGAFTRTLPDNFTVANYARQGFFELCLVMALNFSLLWIVGRSSKTGNRERKISLIMCTLLLIESIMFSVTAFSKIYFYIASYGFTPLRLQSIWLVTVLFAGCISVLASMWSGKQTSRFWLVFSGVSLAVMHLY